MALTKLTTNLIDGTIVTSVNGSSGAVTLETGTDWQTAIQTSNFTAVASKGYFVNTTSAAITVTLPVGVVGTEIVIQDYAGTFATNKVILTANGSEKIQGESDAFKCDTKNATVTLIYQDATRGWTASNISTNVPPFTVNYLVVAGGGSGAWQHGGGGGAGGLRTSYGSTTGGGGSAESALTLIKGINYAVIIGAGAPSVNGVGSNTAGVNGSNSVFATITSTGGGGGSAYAGATVPGDGGSGGGGGNQTSTTQLGGLALSPTQGHIGGTGGTGAANYPSGGGGGAGAAGGNASGNTNGGPGGIGLSISITGTGVYYAGGGGSGTYNGGTPGTGGNGGGGAGVVSGNSNSGTPNTGGGGGGVGTSAPSMTGGGGSGIVILRYSNSLTISGLTGSTTTVGTDKVTTFTNVATGNIQFN